jgi:hypothetical protein
MTRRIRSVVIAACLLTGASSATGCGSSGSHVTTTPSLGAVTAPVTASTAKSVTRVGRPLVLSTGGTRVKVVVQRVIDPLPAIKPDKPAALDHLVAVKLSLTNVGQTNYRASPSDIALLMTTGGLRAPEHPVTRGPCVAFFSTVAIAPAHTLVGCVAYDFLVWAKAVTFRFGPGSNGRSGEWRLR